MRPTTTAHRKALFQVLEFSFRHRLGRVLDLFAGSGALSFEALSRGALCSLLFEKDKKALLCIERNQKFLGLSSQQIFVVEDPRVEKWPSLIQRAQNLGDKSFLYSFPSFQYHFYGPSLREFFCKKSSFELC